MTKAEQDAIFRCLGIRIVRQDANELVLRTSNGALERYLAQPHVTSMLEAEHRDGITRDGVFYEFSERSTDPCASPRSN